MTEPQPYRRVENAILADIRSGHLRPGSKVPSAKELASMHGVAIGTAQKAVGSLKDKGLVVTVQGLGAFVSDVSADRPPTTEERLAALERRVVELQQEIDELRGVGQPA
ncbi:GntR family transcriptional regulator [Kitasatospora sp. NPDC059146]|uniref:GntR family transcriptional regulator n=1 Tax=unclassified Kitasatospora TaxID=2633591 RepID=UPI0036B2A6EC